MKRTTLVVILFLLAAVSVGSALAVGRQSDLAAAYWLGVQHVDLNTGVDFERAKPCVIEQWEKDRNQLSETQEETYQQGILAAQSCVQ